MAKFVRPLLPASYQLYKIEPRYSEIFTIFNP
jgi:hypothetical protein